MDEKIITEVKALEKHMLEMESKNSSLGFSGSKMLEQQLHINQSLLKIIKNLTDHPKDEHWV